MPCDRQADWNKVGVGHEIFTIAAEAFFAIGAEMGGKNSFVQFIFVAHENSYEIGRADFRIGAKAIAASPRGSFALQTDVFQPVRAFLRELDVCRFLQRNDFDPMHDLDKVAVFIPLLNVGSFFSSMIGSYIPGCMTFPHVGNVTTSQRPVKSKMT